MSKIIKQTALEPPCSISHDKLFSVTTGIFKHAAHLIWFRFDADCGMNKCALLYTAASRTQIPCSRRQPYINATHALCQSRRPKCTNTRRTDTPHSFTKRLRAYTETCAPLKPIDCDGDEEFCASLEAHNNIML